jgi:hypothetical protein
MLIYSVITGDLIASTKASPEKLEAAMASIATTAAFLTDYTGADTRFTRFRGDGWQLVLTPQYYLRAIALILAGLKTETQTLSTRFGIGFGPVDSLGTVDLSDAKGSAFVHSGHALDSLKRDQTAMLSAGMTTNGTHGAKAERLRGAVEWSDAAMLPMFSFIARRWSRAQAEAMGIALKNDSQTQATIAEQLGITRQALNLRLTGAGYIPILTAMRLTETYFRDVVAEEEPEQ